MGIEKPLEELHAGKITFGEFARRTDPDFDRLAARMHGRWQVPASYGPEDVKQEMLTEAWIRVGRWDRNKAPLGKFVVFNCCARAKDEIHKAREARGRRGTSHSRHPLPVMAEPGTDPDEVLRRLRAQTCSPDEGSPILVIECREREALLARQARNAEPASTVSGYRLRSIASAGGDLDLAAELLYRKTKWRLACRLGSIDQAFTAVVGEAARLRKVGG